VIPIISYTCGKYTVSCSVGKLPYIFPTLLEHATLYDDFGISEDKGTLLFVTVKKTNANLPELLISQRFTPGPEAGFHPGILLVPENDLLFVGAGLRILAYDLCSISRLWEDQADTGFWGWARHGDTILMSAELELAAWDTYGKKLWTTFVEPPWDYKVSQGQIELDVMGEKSVFSILRGPDQTIWT
jgi:hypothetical protein